MKKILAIVALVASAALVSGCSLLQSSPNPTQLNPASTTAGATAIEPGAGLSTPLGTIYKNPLSSKTGAVMMEAGSAAVTYDYHTTIEASYYDVYLYDAVLEFEFDVMTHVSLTIHIDNDDGVSVKVGFPSKSEFYLVNEMTEHAFNDEKVRTYEFDTRYLKIESRGELGLVGDGLRNDNYVMPPPTPPPPMRVNYTFTYPLTAE
jgi:hypothetical protein